MILLGYWRGNNCKEQYLDFAQLAELLASYGFNPVLKTIVLSKRTSWHFWDILRQFVAKTITLLSCVDWWPSDDIRLLYYNTVHSGTLKIGSLNDWHWNLSTTFFNPGLNRKRLYWSIWTDLLTIFVINFGVIFQFVQIKYSVDFVLNQVLCLPECWSNQRTITWVQERSDNKFCRCTFKKFQPTRIGRVSSESSSLDNRDVMQEINFFQFRDTNWNRQTANLVNFSAICR